MMNFGGFESLTDSTGIATLVGGLLILFIVALLIYIAWLVVYIIGGWKLFEKAGQPGWKIIIPFYNKWTLYEIAGLEWYWFVASIAGSILGWILPNTNFIFQLISLLGSVATIMAEIGLAINLTKKLGKEKGFAVLMFLFGGIMIPIAGFSKNIKFDKDAPVDKNSYLEKYFNKQKKD